MRSLVHRFFSPLVLSLLCLLLLTFPLYASITLRVLAVNPSEDSNQTAPIKVYLPMEVKPEDIINKEDLEVGYDTQQGSCYVFGEYELKPKQALEKSIEIKDIWAIDAKQIISLRKESQDVFLSFEKAGFSEKAAPLQVGINKRLSEVEKLQSVSVSNPSAHISNYRYATNLLDSVRSDLVSAKTMLSEVAPKSAIKITWKLIVFIVIFLGVLGLAFYIIWQRQAKIEAESKE